MFLAKLLQHLELLMVCIILTLRMGVKDGLAVGLVYEKNPVNMIYLVHDYAGQEVHSFALYYISISQGCLVCNPFGPRNLPHDRGCIHREAPFIRYSASGT
ncbi:unnamed protein product [Prorocentrum cordatum]|uniref:Secreted protein n=1 Tax=Prorocentrum cordatum TaxID=2364126 RepID=A0ABN9T895_9DINO|nr:unnamed protein product [Polarella glacialis]